MMGILRGVALAIFFLQSHAFVALCPKPKQSFRQKMSTEEVVQESPNEKLIYDARTGRFYEKELEEVCRDEYCAFDETTGEQVLLTTEEKERIFLDSIQSFYYSDKKILSDEDFEKLKEDLAWEGSAVVTMNRQETLFLNAMTSYLKGNPILSDQEFDELKAELKEAGSKVAVSTEPKCYIDTGICTSNFRTDRFRIFTLYTPVGVPTLLVSVGALYEILEPLKHVNPLVILLLATLPTYFITKVLTENIFATNNAMVAYGPCPSCGAVNRVFFGDVLGVKGLSEQASLNCQSCKKPISIRKTDLRARANA